MLKCRACGKSIDIEEACKSWRIAQIALGDPSPTDEIFCLKCTARNIIGYIEVKEEQARELITEDY